MADVEDLDLVLTITDSVVDQKRTVKEFSDRRALSNQASHSGKPRKQLNMGD